MYILLVLGHSPAVLTELLWRLVGVERNSIAGIEIWTTRSGERRLQEVFDGPGWNALQDATGPLPPLEPAGTAPSDDHGTRVHVFTGADGPLDDVRTEEEALEVNATLHDRLRSLRASLPPKITIVGSMAGGRKTLSAALQTAFSMQADRGDRLVHVLLHSTLERYLQELTPEERGMYLFPTDDWAERSGVPTTEQVEVYDIPFPRLRALANPSLAKLLTERDWKDLWPELERNTGRRVTARLERDGIRWRYILRREGAQPCTFSLPPRAGSLLAAIVVSEDNTAQGLIDWLDERQKIPKAYWTPKEPKKADDFESRPGAIRTGVRDLRKRLADLPPGLEQFSPAMNDYTISPHIAVEDWESEHTTEASEA